MNEDYEKKILNKCLAKLKIANNNELSYIEIKQNNIDPLIIGSLISAIANTCLKEGLEKGFILFGIEDGTLNEIGVNFDPFNVKYTGKQDLEIWLRQMVLGVDFRFLPFKAEDGRDYLIIQISKALGRIATFQKKAYIRIGKNVSELHNYPDIEKIIWSKLDKRAFWLMPIRENLTQDKVLELLDSITYYELIRLPYPSNKNAVVERLEQEGFAIGENGLYSITNLGALLFANDMNDFPSLKYKTPRVVTYEGDNKLSTVIKDKEILMGYAKGFEVLLEWIYSQIPEPQIITKTFREQRVVYPKKGIRELVANALIHQDCEEVGMRPLIEIYKNRIVISNPGNCLVPPERILGAIPKARNEILVDIMKRLYICETRGSGIPRTIEGIEEIQLPAPTFENQDNAFKVELYAFTKFDRLSTEEKLRACVQHVTFMYVMDIFANNETLRKRFGLGEKKTNAISKLVRLAKDKGLIKEADPKNNSKKYIKYVPFWA
jgi:predicted HTH transcriptional regulator